MIPKGFWNHLSKQDKDTAVFLLIFVFVIFGEIKVGVDALYLIATGAVFIALYILMRIALLRVQLAEREANLKRAPARRAREIVDATTNQTEKQVLDNFKRSVKTKQK